MRKLLHLLLLFATSFLLADMRDPDVLAATEGDPSASVSEYVNMLTGDLTLFEEDYCVPGAQPIPLRRAYISGDGKGKDGSWQFFPHTHLTLLSRHPEHNKHKHSRRALAYEPSGSLLTYKVRDPERDDEGNYYVDFEKHGKGITNTSHGVISARTNFKNQWIEHKKHKLTLHCADGTTRKYGLAYHEDKLDLFLLRWEHLPNGNWIFYEYDEAHRLRHVKTTNPSKTLTYAWVRFHYLTKPDDSRNFTAETSDGKQIEYIFDRYKNKKTGKVDFYLKTVNNPTRPLEEFSYTPHKLFPGRFITKRSFSDGRYIQADYYTEENHTVQGIAIEIKESHHPALERVKTLYAPVGPNEEPIPIQRFIYHIDKSKKSREQTEYNYTELGQTDAFDANGCKTTIQFNQAFHPTAIAQYDPQGKLHQRTEMRWENNGQLAEKHLLNSQGEKLWSRTLTYDTFGNVIEETFSGDLRGVNTTSSFSKKMRYNEEHLPIWQQDDTGAITTFTYLPGTNLLTSRLISDKTGILKREFFTYNTDNILITSSIDNGSSPDLDDLTDVTQRLITTTKLKTENPLINFPEEIIETTWDAQTQQELLLRKTHLTYTIEGRISRKASYDSQNALAYTLHYTYDTHGNLISETNPLGQVQTSTYDKFDNLILIEHFGGHSQTEMEYDASNRLIRSTFKGIDGITRTTRHTYDIKHNRTSTTDPFGNTTRFTYDPFGNLIKTALPTLTTQTSYDDHHRAISSTSSRGDTTLSTYTAYNKPTLITHPTGATDRLLYNEDGTLSESIDTFGVRTTHTYDIFGHELCRKIIAPNHDILSIERWTYNAFQLLSHTPPGSPTTTYVYDSAGRKIAEYDTFQRINYTYDTLGRLATISTSDGTHTLTSSKTYDLLDRILEERAHDEHSTLSLTTYTYDSSGNQTSLSRLGSRPEFFTYDSLSRLTSHTDPLGHKSTTTYTDNQIISIDPAGIRTIQTHDLLGRPTSLETTNTFQTLSLDHFFYDIGGKLCRKESTRFPSSRVITTLWTYGPNERLLSQTEAAGTPLAKTTRYTYTLKEQLHQTIKPDNVILTSTYDLLGRLSTLTSSDNTINYHYRYNSKNQPEKITDRTTNLTLHRFYTPLGQLEAESFPTGLSTQHVYDSMGRRTELVLPDDTSILYTYDALHLRTVTRLTKDGTYSHHYDTYNPLGQPLSQTLIHNLGTLTTTYDPLGRPTTLSAPSLTQSLSYDPTGNITQLLSNNTLTTYTYDDLSQLTSENNHTYTYDSHHNRLSHNADTYTPNDLDQLSTLTYDPNGNPLTHNDTTYTYDALDRLTSVTTPTIRLTFTYDGLHRRLTKTTHIWKNDTTSTIHFLYDDQNEIGAANRSNKLIQLRILGASPKAEISAAIAIELYGSTYAPIHDLQGNLSTLLDLTGAPAETLTYTSFGTHTPNLSPWCYFSKRTDPETNLIYFGHRFYDPTLGRFLTPDPAGLATSPNLYTFVNNNPLALLDLYGLEAESAWGRAAETCLDAVGTGIGYVGQAISFTFRHLMPLPNDARGLGMAFGATLINFSPTPCSIVQERHSHYDTVNKKPPPSHHRVIVVNGMLNSDQDSIDFATEVSNLLNDMEVTRVYGSSRGFLLDVLECIAQKFGIMTHSDSVLLSAIHANLRALNGSGSGGTLHLLAHSQGGLIARNALSKLSPSERAMIEVTTFGSASFFEFSDLKSFQHIVSNKDPIQFLSFITCWSKTKRHITTVPSQTSFPDHLINDKTYSEELKKTCYRIKGKIGEF